MIEINISTKDWVMQFKFSAFYDIITQFIEMSVLHWFYYVNIIGLSYFGFVLLQSCVLKPWGLENIE